MATRGIYLRLERQKESSNSLQIGVGCQVGPLALADVTAHAVSIEQFLQLLPSLFLQNP